MTKVSQWAWLLSSENERVEEEEEEEEGEGGQENGGYASEAEAVLGPFSPLERLEKECHQESPSVDLNPMRKSWEWLVSEADLTERSFESNETSQESTIHGDTEHSSRAEVGLGLHQKIRLGSRIEAINREHPPPIDAIDTSIVSTPDLGKRESKTTAAIEALLSQIQLSQEQPLILPSERVDCKVGTSYLYKQMLKKIAEEGGSQGGGGRDDFERSARSSQ